MPNLTCTPDATKTKAHRQVVGVDNAGGIAYCKATGLYNKHRMYSEQWNPWHPFQSAHDFQQAQSFSQQTKMWIDQHLERGLDNFKIESFQSADALRNLLSQLDFGLSDDSWIEDDSHILGTLYYSDIFKCVQFILAHLPFQAHLNFKPVCLADSENRRVYSEMNTGDWWWDTQDQLRAGATIVPVICASNKTHLTNDSGDQHAWPLYLTIGNIRKDIRRTPTKCALILVGLIPCPPKGANNTDEAWHSAVGTMLSPLRNLDITGPGLKWNCADGFQRQCYPLLAAWVGDYPEQVMIAQVSYGSCPMCEIPTGALMEHSTIRPLDDTRDQDVYLELLDETNIDILHNLGVHPIRNQFWQYPLCNVYRLWQPAELHQLLLGLVKDLLHWLLKYLKARNIKDQFDNRFTSVPRYPGLQLFSKPFDSMKSSSWQGKEIRAMIRSLAVNCAPILDCCKDDGKTPAETASDEIVMGAVRALCEFSLLVSQQNLSDLSLTAQDYALNRCYRKKGAFRELKMSKSGKAQVDELLARESHQLREQKIHKIHAAMVVQVYGAEKVTTTKQRQFQVRLNRARQAATIWSDADRQSAKERLEREIHQVTPDKRKLFDKLFQHHKRQRLQEVGTKATSPRSTFAKKLAQMTTAAEEEVYEAANMTANKRVKFQIRLSDAETEATSLSIADTDRIANQLEREIYGVTSNEQMRFKMEFCIRLIAFEACWQAIGVQELRRTIKQHVIHVGYPTMHLVSHISESIQRMGSGDNFTTDIPERVHIANVKEAYPSTNKVNYIWQMLKHNDRCTGLDYMEDSLSHLALQGWYDIDSAEVFNLLSAADKRQNTGRAHLLRVQYCQEEPFFRPVSQQVHHLRETHVRGVCRSIKPTLLTDASEDFGIPNFGQLFRAQIEEDWGHEVCGLVLGYDQNVLIDSIFIKLHNGLLYYCQPFHCPTSVEHLRLDCKVEYTNANQGIMPESHNIWVQYMESDLDNTFQGRVPSFPVLYFSWTPPNQILQFQERLPAGKMILTFSKRCKKTEQWILRPQPQEYAVVIPTKYQDPHGWADCVDGFIRVVKQTDMMDIVPVGAMVGPAHLVRENAASDRIDSVWLVNNHVDLDTYWTVY